MALNRTYPNVPLKCAKRDINAASGQIRPRSDSSPLFHTGSTGSDIGTSIDVISGYLVLPFGWAGAPGVCASVAEIITRYHNLSSPSNVLWDGDTPFKSRSFVEDGIPIAPDLSGRLSLCVAVCKEGSYMVIGPDSADKINLC